MKRAPSSPVSERRATHRDASAPATVGDMREFMLACSSPRRLPPPVDLDAEQMLVAAVLSPAVPLDRFDGVAIDDFSAPLFAVLFSAAVELRRAGIVPTDNAILGVLEANDIYLPHIEHELRVLRDETPTAIRPVQFAARVRLLAARRRALENVLRAEAELRSPQFDQARVREFLLAALHDLEGLS